MTELKVVVVVVAFWYCVCKSVCVCVCVTVDKGTIELGELREWWLGKQSHAL